MTKLFSDSQAALKTLNSCRVNSETIMECRRSLNEIEKHYKIKLHWVPGHQTLRLTVSQRNWLEKGQPSKFFNRRTRLECP